MVLAQEQAQQFATEFAIAQAAGSDLRGIDGVRSAITSLRAGVSGAGPYRQLVFRVQGVEVSQLEAVSHFLVFERGLLCYRPPIPFHAAWSTGSAPLDHATPSHVLSRMLAERKAESVARVYGSARAAAADLSQVKDVETALRALEQGAAGSGSHAGVVYKIAAIHPGIRFIVKKMLRFHENDLVFIPGVGELSEEQIATFLEQNRPARIAQQVAATFTNARLAGVDFSAYPTPNLIIAILREGVHVTSQLGTQAFRISAKATEAEWGKSVAYLRLRDGTLTYTPPSRLPR